MNIGIVGLGLIGASIAKAFKKNTDYYIMGIDTNHDVLNYAINMNIISETLNRDNLAKADIIYLCLYPQDCIDFMEKNKNYIGKQTIVTDTCGIKSYILRQMKNVIQNNNIIFVSGHPMAYKESNGITSSEADLFKNSNYIFILDNADIKYIEILKRLAYQIGCSKVIITTAEEHDKIIAFTSQLPHVLACAYVLNPTSARTCDFHLESFENVSKVADINEELWTQLFLLNSFYLSKQLEQLITDINKIKLAIDSRDKDRLKFLLNKSRSIKQKLNSKNDI